MVEFTKMGGEVPLDRWVVRRGVRRRRAGGGETDMVDGLAYAERLPDDVFVSMGYVEKRDQPGLHPAYRAARRR
ncbi:MAG: hypothetical protein ACLTDR_12610 [Adlercreutzia equolifaciens]